MGFLRPTRMVKVRCLGLKEDRDAVVRILHDLGVLQVEPLAKEALALLAGDPSVPNQRRIADELLRFRSLKAALPLPGPVSPRSFASVEAILEAARSVRVDEEVLRLSQEEDRCETERRQLSETISILERHTHFQEPLRTVRARSLLAFFGEAPNDEFASLRRQVEATGEALFSAASAEREIRFFLAVPSSSADAVSRIAQQAGVHLSAVPPLDGTIAQELPALQARREAVERRIGEIQGRLREIAQTSFGTIASIEEALAIENRKIEAMGRMGAGRAMFAVEGWVPERDLPRLEQAIRRAAGDRAILESVPTKEEAPTLMANPKGIRWYEFYIRFYAIPRADEFDPTWIFALAFPIFFGFMLGDWGYGLVILAISAWMVAGFPGGSKIPRFVKSLPLLIMGPNAMRSLAWTLLPSATLAIALGGVYNQVFGFHLPFYTGLADPIRNVGKLLVLAGYIGLAMVTVGFALGAIKSYLHGHRRELGVRVSGIVFAWGIAFAGLEVIHAHRIPLGAPLFDVYVGITVAGFLGMLILEQFQGVMGVIEIVSHILSYTRLVGILLASVILAAVINQIFWGFWTNGTAWGWAPGLVILIVGQLFNLILAVFEPGIQGARLIFVEHFSKFYEGNGRPFTPLASTRQHTVPWVGDSAPAPPTAASPLPATPG